jgi:hypothetical protein
MDEADGHLSSPSTSMAVEQAAIVMVEREMLFGKKI